jgi:hypothetical protein
MIIAWQALIYKYIIILLMCTYRAIIMIHHTTFILFSLLFFISSSAFACDDKSCETAYLNSTKQYVSLGSSHAEAAQRERVAYAKVRENRQKKINEQLVREARSSVIYIINNALLEGQSMEQITQKIEAAYNSGAIKAQAISLEQLHTESTTDKTESSVWSLLNRIFAVVNR